MITARITQYQFEGCDLNLFRDRGAYWARVYSPALQWEMTTSLPKSCPIEAFMLAELEILKTKLRLDKHPACLMEIRKNKEIILATNKLDRQLFGGDATGSIASNYVANQKRYRDFLDTAKRMGYALTNLDLLGAKGNLLHLKIEGRLIKSPVSLMIRLYTRTIESL